MSPTDWMTTLEAALYLRFVNVETGEPDRAETRRYLDAKGVRSVKRGRTVMFDREGVKNSLDVRRAS